MNAITNTADDEALWFGNSLVSIKLSSQDGADGICVVEHWAPSGDAPPLHLHRNEDEVFHIIEGTMRFRVGDDERVAGRGETVIGPKGIPHAYRVESADGAHYLTITRGADFETMLRQASRPAGRAALPEPVVPTPETIERLVKACAENGIDILGPPIA